MIDKFRNVKFIKAMMWIVALAFIGLIVLEWGADFSGRRDVGPVGDTVGIINGEKISHQEFDQILRNAYRQAKQDGASEPELGPLVRQTWDQLVAQVLVAQQIEKYSIEVSDQEVDFFNRVQPPQWVRSQEIFQTEGRFDPSKYSQFLDDPGTYANPQMKQFVIGAESAARQALLNQKLQGIIAGSVQVTEAEIRKAYEDQHETVRVAYVGTEASAIPDTLISVDEPEIQAYYDAHKEDFQQDRSVRTSFVSFPKTPTPRDEADAKAEIERLLSEIRSGVATFADQATAYSDDPGSAQRGGDLGFFGRGQMVKAFEDLAFALETGQVSNPFRTRFGWHILKVEERKGAGDSLQVRARHILLQVQPGRTTTDSLSLLAETFRERAEEIGFDAAVAEMGLSQEDTGFITAGGFFPVLNNRTAGLVNAFLDASPGANSPTYETDQGIYIFTLREKREAGPRPLTEVRSQVLSRLKQEKKVDLAAQRLSPVPGEASGGKSLKEIADARGLRHAESEPFARDDFIPRVGGRNAFIGAAFRLQPGQISDVVKTEQGAYVIQFLESQPVDETKFQEEKEQMAQRIVNQKRNEVVGAWFNDLIEQAQIEDNRHHFYYDF